MLTIGTGFGLMSLSVIIADCVMLYCTKNKSLYQKIKEINVKDSKKHRAISEHNNANPNKIPNDTHKVKMMMKETDDIKYIEAESSTQ